MKLRPIRREDLVETYGEVFQPVSMVTAGSDNSVESVKIFGSLTNEDKVYENTGIYNRRGYIHFPIGVLNFFLAGKDAGLLKVILNRKDVKDIAEGQVMFDVANQKEITVDDLKHKPVYTQDILIGGDYIKYLIDELDVEGEIIKSINEMMMHYVGSYNKDMTYKERVAVLNQFGRVTKDEGTFPIVDKYYFTCNDGVDLTEYIEDIREDIAEILGEYNSRLTLLLSIRDDKSKIRDQVMEYMIVLPIGYRPPFQKKRDPLTKAYDSVVRVNAELWSIISGYNTSLDVVRNCYLDLVRAVKHVTVQNMDPYDEQYKPLAELIKGKHGLIRDKMQGTRTDYTGRSVIIVDPDMSVDTIGVPESMATNLMEHEVLKRYSTKSENKRGILKGGNQYLKRSIARKALEGDSFVTGRQPTLYRLGARGFKTKIVDGSAIVLNPLSTPAFNADFDGDQMYGSVPISDKAKEEVRVLMSPVNNIFLPKDGECHIAPRQEIIYGLWKATSIGFNSRSKEYVYPDNSDSYNDVYEKVCNQEIAIYDKIKLGANIKTAGYIAVKACLKARYRDYRLGVLPLTRSTTRAEAPVSEKYFKELNKAIALESKTDFVYTTDRLVKLGFAVAEYFPATLSVLKYEDVSDIIKEFDAKVSEREELFNMGFESERSFTAFYNTEYQELESKIKKAVKKGLGAENGFVELAESGARGSASNLMQLFGMKGRVMKNSAEAFNAILKHSLAQQLTGLEHFVTAYGARQGLMDKSIATYGPGYLSRQMSHAASSLHITTEDCGTTNGLHLTYDFLKQFVKPEMLTGNPLVDNRHVKDLAIKMLVGRYVVGINHEIRDVIEADSVYNSMIASIDQNEKELKIKAGLKMRSPMMCECPVCTKCYGRDLGTQAPSVVGLPIGFEAATAIGEPTTQLIMKNFQSGGVAGVTNLTSSFDIVKRYAYLTKKTKKDAETPIDYDFISPVEGYIETISRGDGTKKLEIKMPNKKGVMVKKLQSKIILPEDVKLKSYVKVGESIQEMQGDLNIHEIARYRSPEEAQAYLAVMLFNIFQKEVFVSSKHFEVLVAAMTFRVCLKGNDYFKPGKFYTTVEYWGHDRTGCDFKIALKGVNDVPIYRNDVCSTIFMEKIQKGISRSIIVSGEDELKLPIVRYTFGLMPNVGSAYPGFIESRGKL